METLLKCLYVFLLASCARVSEAIPILVPIDSVATEIQFSFPACDSIHLRQSGDKPPMPAPLGRRSVPDADALNHPTRAAWLHAAWFYSCAPAVCFPRHLPSVSNFVFYTSGFT